MDDRDLFDMIFCSATSNVDKKNDGISYTESLHDEDVNSEKAVQVLRENIDIIDRTSYNPSFREIPRFRKPFGGIVVFIKRIIRKLTKFYIEPYTEQQNQYNAAVRNSIKCLYDRSEEEHYSSLATKEVLARFNAQIINQENASEEIMNTQKLIQQELTKIDSQLKEQSSTQEAQKKEFEEQSNILCELRKKNNTQNEEYTILKKEFHLAFQKISEMEDITLQIKEITSQVKDRTLLSYAQSGEDSIIQYILKSLEISAHDIRYLDLGANHAKEISNTYSLYVQGARGVLLEANPRLIPELSLYRGEDVIIAKCLVTDSEIKTIPFYVLNGDGLSSFDKEAIEDAIAQNSSLRIDSIEQVQTITINEIIECFFPKAPELLNIDIEGAEEQILESINFEEWRPLIIILETIPYHPYLVFDEKRQELVQFLQKRDYTEYAFTGINSIMLDKRQLNVRIRK